MRPQKVVEAIVLSNLLNWETEHIGKGSVYIELIFEDGETAVKHLEGNHTITDLTVVYPDPLYWNHHD